MSDSLLGVLVGEQLGLVVFVMDYLQLDFSAARFTAYVWPAVTRDGVTKRFGDRGDRDALCAFIAEEVRSVEESYEAGLEITFELGRITTNPWRPIYVAPRLPSCRCMKTPSKTRRGRCGDPAKMCSPAATGRDGCTLTIAHSSHPL